MGDSVIQIFKNENITGDVLLLLSKEDLGALGVRTFRDKLVLGNFIGELRAEWTVRQEGMGSGVGKVVLGQDGGGSSYGSYGVARMEDGKGAPLTDAPPSYSVA
jgi:hypothetical protein